MLLQSPDENWHRQLPLLRNPHVPDDGNFIKILMDLGAISFG
jgi:hypothetical protein